MVRRELDELVRLARATGAGGFRIWRPRRRPARSSSPTPTAASRARRGSACPSARWLRRGPAARARHAERRVREGISPRRRGDPLPRLPPVRPVPPLASTNGAGCARSRAIAAPARLGTRRWACSARCATTLPSRAARARSGAARFASARRRFATTPARRRVRRSAPVPTGCRRGRRGVCSLEGRACLRARHPT